MQIHPYNTRVAITISYKMNIKAKLFIRNKRRYFKISRYQKKNY